MRYLYIILGSVSLAIGLLGIVTPGLPTTPFILLTAFLFAKGSPNLYRKLHEHKLTGSYIKRINGRISTKALLISLSIMWAMICFTTFVVFSSETKRLVMLGLGLIGTISQIVVFINKRRKYAANIALSNDSLEEKKNITSY
ncbi:YbaN family protein [Dysgonomonas sp. 511]|uniref:YbaN family protein n=1 Tax=Dysgonomonas sp. 511 TaxID=2302930 RepID=UPI0013CF51EB|nr:YbaN family protein [Dysgonomonas sp. 511]NDV79083.1 DUF454 domain-containing protein [Dysgonomonas sp. 511]